MSLTEHGLHEMDKHLLDSLVNENAARVDLQIEKILSKKPKKASVLVAADFDECAIKWHVCREVTNVYANRGLITEADRAGFDLVSIAHLFNCYVDLSKNEFNSEVMTLAKKSVWRPGAIEAFNYFNKAPFFFVIISSGVAPVIRMTCEQQDLYDINIIADELDYGLQHGERVIKGAYLIIGDKEKGEVVAKLNMLGNFDKTITLGHSKGDVPLILAGTPGLRFSLRDKQEAIDAADTVVDTWTELIQHVKKNV